MFTELAIGIAASDPVRHWPIVLVGLLGKIFGPIGFVQAVLNERFPLAMGLTIVTNDLIWWVPFALILWNAKKWNSPPATVAAVEESNELRASRTQRGPHIPRSKIVWSSVQGAVGEKS